MCFFKRKKTPTNGLIYELRDDGYKVSGIKNFGGKEIVLPELEKGKPVTGNFMASNFEAPEDKEFHLSKSIKEWFPIKNCPKFENYSVDKDHPKYAVVKGVLFDKDMTMLIDVPCGRSGKFVLPPMKKLLFPICSPFGGCDKITELDFTAIKDQLEMIQLGKLCKGMTALKKIVLPTWCKDRPWAGPAFGEFADMVEYR